MEMSYSIVSEKKEDRNEQEYNITKQNETLNWVSRLLVKLVEAI